MPPAFDELMRTQALLALEVVDSTLIGDSLAVLYRERVVDDWVRVVLKRTALDEFTIFSEGGDAVLEKVPYGLDEDG
eukprot:1142205-Pleurochrysis_carterae.AAC.1